MSWSLEVESPASAGRLFKALYLDWHNLGPKIVPHLIVSGTLVSGDGGEGSVRNLVFTSAFYYDYLTERLDGVDHEKFEGKQILLEGGYLGKELNGVTLHSKFEPSSSNGGCLVKIEATFKVIHGIEFPLEKVEMAKNGMIGRIRAAEAYLQANPTAYA